MESNYKVGDLIYDAKIYDGMNKDLGDLEFYRRWLPKNKDARILELCCGTGRLTIPLAKEGYSICGVDFMSSMLEQATKKATKEGVAIDFVEADIRKLDLAERFDLIFIPFNSIHHLYNNEDLFQAFKVVKKHLKEGGFFLLDCFNPDIRYIVESEKEQLKIAEYTTEDGRTILIKQSMQYETSTQVNRIEWHYYINGQFDSVQNLDMRLFFPKELDAYLKQHDFKILHKFGSFDEAAFEDQSNKQIFICQ